jgi:hypothetical protein
MTGADAWIYRNDFPLSWGWFKYLPKWSKRVTMHVYQRLTRVFSDADMWNANLFLADVIAGTADWHFRHNRGFPADITNEEWLDILSGIRDGFTQDDDVDWVPAPWAWDLFRARFNDLWD